MKELFLTSSVLIVAVALLRTVFRSRVSARLRYALWGLVLLRLLIPVQFGSLSFSVSSLAQDSPPITAIEQQISAPIAAPDYEVVYQTVQREFENKGYDISKPEIVTQIVQQTEEKLDLPTWEEVLKLVWISGTIAMAVWFTVVNSRFLRSAEKSAVPLNAETPVPVYESAGVTSPCLTGLFRPVIYLTPAAAEDERLRRHALTHELTHYRHGDHIWSLLRSLCLCVYWFHPLVWLAAILSRRDCELACDEGALKLLGENERISYGKSLLDVVAGNLSPSHLLEAATAMNESKRQLTERVERIVKKPKFYITAAVCLFLAAGIIAGCTFAGSTPDPEPVKDEYLLLETVTTFHGDGDLPETTAWSRNYYNENGHFTKIIEYSQELAVLLVECDSSGNPLRKYTEDGSRSVTCTYDKQGNILSRETCLGGELTSTEAWTYDKNGNELTFRQEFPNAFTREIVKTYDGKGNLLTQTDTTAEQVARIECSYGDDGKLSQTMFYQNGELYLRYAYEYTGGDHNYSIIAYDASGTETGRIITDYDEASRTRTTTSTTLDGSEDSITVETYDEADNLLTQQVWHYGELFMTIRNRYIRPGEAGVYTLTSMPEETVPDGTDPEETVPEPTGVQLVPQNITAARMVTTWKEEILDWEDSVGNINRFTARIPMLYPFSNDACEINNHIFNKYGAILEEAYTAASDGYSAGYLGIDYKAYLNGNILSLVIILDTGYDYIDYEVYNFYLEPGEFAVTMNPAAMAEYCLGLSYPEFLYAAAQFTLDYLEMQYPDASAELIEDFKSMYLDMYGMPLGHNPLELGHHALYLGNRDTLMLRFDCPSIAGADYYPTLARFNPIETDPGECYRWLFNIHADGAYATAHDALFCDAFLAAPEEFLHYLDMETYETITRVAQGIGCFCHPNQVAPIREVLASLPDSNFKTTVLEALDEYYP